MRQIFKNKRIGVINLSVIFANIICLVIFVNSCSKDDNFKTEVVELDIPKEYNEVGKLHNEGLEYIFEEIKAQGIEYSKNPRLKSRPFMGNKEEFVKQATLDFCMQNKKLQKNIDFCKSVLKNSVPLKSSGSEDFSPALKQLLNEITVVLRQEFKKNEMSRLKTQLDGINQKAARTLSETDAAVIYCTTSTGYCSYQYWMNNHKKMIFCIELSGNS